MKANPVSETRNSAPSDVKQGDDKWIRYNLDGDAVINFDDTRTAHHAAQRWTTLSDLLREGDGDAPSVRIARAAAEPQTEKETLSTLSAIRDLKRFCEQHGVNALSTKTTGTNSPDVEDN